MYCKKLTSAANLDVERRISRAQLQILCWAQTAKHPKIVNEMRLVEVSARQSDIHPVHRLPAVNSSEHVMEPLNAAEEFGGHSDFVSKEFNETPLAETGSFRNLRARAQPGIILKLSHSERNRRVVIQRAFCNPQQPIFKNSKFRFHCWCVVETTEQLTRPSFAPEIVKSDAVVMQFTKGKSDKRKGAARFEVDAQQFIVSGSFNDDGLRPCAGNPGIRRSMPFEPDYKFYRAVGQYPLFGVRHIVPPPVPEKTYEFGKPPARDVVLGCNGKCGCRFHRVSIAQQVSG
jgi:hypothetical protein